ncbi:MAG: RpoL/Rpb11 RNA polymerase subunit family protein [Promethearchaeota archaeon]
MAKKPPKEEDLDDNTDLDLSDDDTQELPPGTSGDDEEYPEEEDFEEEIIEKKDYKHLKLELTKGLNENDHVLLIEGQSHGFCNALVKQLLPIKGVTSAAYRITSIKPPEVFIRLENGYKIRDILFEAIESLRNEVLETQEIFKELM